MNPILYPPLSLIEAELFGTCTVESTAVDDGDSGVPDLPMPPDLADLVRRRVASDVLAAHAPAAGQIRRLDTGRACGVLLCASLGGKRWRGWLVAQEADYASERDLVLQDDDAILAPEAAMVQAWNPVECVIMGHEALLGTVPAGVLGAVVRLADLQAGLGDEGVLPRPGRLGAWDLDEATVVVTGTPLDGADDPRYAYRRLYRRLAGQVQAVPQARDVRSSARLFAWLGATFVRPAWTFCALALVAVQGLWILDASLPQDLAAPVYRSAGLVPTQACAPRLRVVFRADAAYADIVGALRQVQAVLVQGPSEDGEVWVDLPSGVDARATAAGLANLRAVVQASLAVPAHPECRP